MDTKRKYENNVELEIMEEEELTAKDIDSALESIAEWLIDRWLKKNHGDILSNRSKQLDF